MSYDQLAVTSDWLRSILTNGKNCKLAKLQQQIAMTKIKLDPRLKPIMSAALEEEVEAALVQYENVKLWKEWGMDLVRKQGNAVALLGPPGTGKTVIANYMSKRVGRSMVQINMKDLGGKAPGSTERMVAESFAAATARGNQTIFMDECEAVLWDRSKAGSDSMWMVGVIDEILMQVAKYKGLIVFASNRPEIIDPALMDRCFATLQVGMPEQPERIKLWRQKIPVRFPLKLTTVQIEALAAVAINGRQIENALVREASHAIAKKRGLPTFESLLAQAQAAHK